MEETRDFEETSSSRLVNECMFVFGQVLMGIVVIYANIAPDAPLTSFRNNGKLTLTQKIGLFVLAPAIVDAFGEIRPSTALQALMSHS